MDDNERELLQAIDKELDNIADQIFNQSQENLVRPHIKEFNSGSKKRVITTDTSALLQSGNVERKFLDKTIVYTAPYAEDVEEGNPAPRIDEAEIRAWVKRKVLKGKGTKTHVDRVTRKIIAGLRKRGQSPDPFLRPAMEPYLI